jgi:hypothetical protein
MTTRSTANIENRGGRAGQEASQKLTRTLAIKLAGTLM